MQKQLKKAKFIVQRLLEQYPRTIKEIKDKLEDKDFDQNVIQETITYFKKLGYLNDEEYVSLWLESRLKRKPVGRLLCFEKLKQRGVSQDLIWKILDKDYPEEKEKELASNLALRKKQDFEKQSLPRLKIGRKIGVFLDRKGFPEGMIWEILEELGLLKE